MPFKNSIKLYREVGQHRRYYYLHIYKNLFSEYILEREYGNVKHKRATGVKTTYYKELDDAIARMKFILEQKYKKGYKKGFKEQI